MHTHRLRLMLAQATLTLVQAPAPTIWKDLFPLAGKTYPHWLSNLWVHTCAGVDNTRCILVDGSIPVSMRSCRYWNIKVFFTLLFTESAFLPTTVGRVSFVHTTSVIMCADDDKVFVHTMVHIMPMAVMH